jgi:hypothetical protein
MDSFLVEIIHNAVHDWLRSRVETHGHFESLENL